MNNGSATIFGTYPSSRKEHKSFQIYHALQTTFNDDNSTIFLGNLFQLSSILVLGKGSFLLMSTKF